MKRYTPEQVQKLLRGTWCRLKKIRAAFKGVESLTSVEILDLKNLPFFYKRYIFLQCTKFFNEAELHELACKFAEAVLPVFEKRFPNDMRPRKAIEAKRAWLRGEITAEELEEAKEASLAAAHAACDAVSVIDVAFDATFVADAAYLAVSVTDAGCNAAFVTDAAYLAANATDAAQVLAIIRAALIKKNGE